MFHQFTPSNGMRLVAVCLLVGAAYGEDTPHAALRDQLFQYEPTYFAIDPGLGSRPVNAKFQLSFSIRLVEPRGSDEDQGALRPDGLYLAYSQTSFWDLQSESKPFLDSSYRPEAWWHVGVPSHGLADNLALEPGIGHESNGRPEDTSRSLNHAFVRLAAEWQVGDLTVLAQPRARIYLEKEENPDLPRYRGYVDWVASVGRRESWQVACTARVGDRFDRGSLQTELTYPTEPLSGDMVHGFIYFQAFLGWSETLLGYNERSDPPHLLVGFAVTR